MRPVINATPSDRQHFGGSGWRRETGIEQIMGGRMYREQTRQISVNVMPVFIDERSAPEENRYFWAYRVVIENNGEKTVQIISRYWYIVDANGAIEEVRGPGVVGEQPVLRPGDSYEYTSGCPLTTPSGFMRGTYTMTDEFGEEFEVVIPAFALDLPDANVVLN